MMFVRNRVSIITAALLLIVPLKISVDRASGLAGLVFHFPTVLPSLWTSCSMVCSTDAEGELSLL
jgi:hypothetical protein